MLLQAPFVDRKNFGPFLQARFGAGLAVEVGTDRGDFALELVKGWPDLKQLTCVDPYICGYDPNDPTSNRTPEQREEDKREALRKLDQFPNVRFVMRTSAAASEMFDQESLDFVYVDAEHQSSQVYADLRTWWPRIKKGGILAGHDFICPGEDIRITPALGVQTGVWQFSNWAMSVGLPLGVYLVVEASESRPWSFYLEKT